MKQGSLLLLISLIIGINACDQFTINSNSKKKKSGKESILNEQGDTVMMTYRKDGSLESSVTIKHGERNGPSYVYYKNGKVQFEIHYKDSFKDSITKYYYESGILYRTTHYKRGIKDGIQTYYYKTGELKAEVPYQQDELVLGTKEYSTSGKLINDYPKIVVEPIDKLAFENKYELRISLNPKMKNVSFYFNKKMDDKNVKIMLSESEQPGVVSYSYYVHPRQSIMEKVIIMAEIKSKRGVPVVLTKTYNLVVDNRTY